MTKPTITKIWLAGVATLVGGLILGGVSLGLMLAFGGHFAPAPHGNGNDFVPNLDSYFWITLSLMISGFAIAAIGAIAQVVAWIGALVNSYQIADKTWFVIVLVGGVLSSAFALIGFAVMAAYLIAAPDGLALRQPPAAMPREAALAPSS